MLPFRTLIVVFALLSGVFTSLSVFAYESVFDRLDGTGPSKKRVDVVEWEGNLEIHVYPKASTKGIGAKLDTREQGKKVMVIGYHFNESKEPLVRRAILGVPFTSLLKGFIDPTEKDFDKIALSNSELPKPWMPYKLAPAPTQWGPDGSKYDESSSTEQLTEMKNNDQQDYKRFNADTANERQSRAPASIGGTKQKVKYVHPAQRTAPVKPVHHEAGIQEYNW